jgi:hypothetical protein
VSRYCAVVAGKRAEGLLEMMLFIELYTLNRAWSGLTDKELLWDPMPGAWTVQPRDKCQTATPFVVGAWTADFDADLAAAAVLGKAIEPLTSIAWLFWHVGSQPARTAELDFLGGAHTAEGGWTSPYITAHPIFTTATDEQLERPTRFWGYGGQPGPMGTGAQVISSVLNEVSHHGTQIGVLRDLYRLRASVSIERYA